VHRTHIRSGTGVVELRPRSRCHGNETRLSQANLKTTSTKYNRTAKQNQKTNHKSTQENTKLVQKKEERKKNQSARHFPGYPQSAGKVTSNVCKHF